MHFCVGGIFNRDLVSRMTHVAYSLCYLRQCHVNDVLNFVRFFAERLKERKSGCLVEVCSSVTFVSRSCLCVTGGGGEGMEHDDALGSIPYLSYPSSNLVPIIPMLLVL